jgi:hypothetical protein
LLIRSANGNLAGFIGATSETGTRDKTQNELTIETKEGLKVITALHINDARLILHYGMPEATIAQAARADLTASVGKK